MKKYFKTRALAIKAKNERDPKGIYGLSVFKMKSGTRHPGMYAVCSLIEYLNTY